MKTDRIDLRVFIEGVLFPYVSSVSVSSGVNEETSATITIPPAPRLETETLLRARVHIFFSDNEIRDSSAANQWPMLFDGEIIGDSFQKTPSGRNLVLQCAGVYTYWRQVLLSYFDPTMADLATVVNTRAATTFTGNKEVQIDVASPVSQASQMAQIIKNNSSNAYGASVATMLKRSLETNGFYQQADSQLKITNRVISPSDAGVSSIINRNSLVQLISADYSSFSGQISVLEVIKAVLSRIHYRIIANPSPKYISKAEGSRLVKKNPNDSTIRSLKISLQQVILKFSGGVDSLALEEFDLLVNSIQKDAASAEIEKSAQDFLKALNESGKLQKSIEETDLDAPGYQYGIVYSVYSDFVTLLKILSESLVDDPSSSTYDVDSATGVSPELCQYICIPDTRFAAVPRCNVFFPSSVGNWGMERDYLSEPTRMFVGAQVSIGVNNFIVCPEDIVDTAEKPSQEVSTLNVSGFCSPINGRFNVLSGFQFRSIPEHLNKRKFHYGIDISGGDARAGADVICVKDGNPVIVQKSEANSGGVHVEIDHGDGVSSRYLHLQSGSVDKMAELLKAKRKPGEFLVKAGDVIGKLGNTGTTESRTKLATHLHFELKVKNKAVDPMPLINAVCRRNGDGSYTGNKTPIVASTADGATVQTVPLKWRADIEQGGGNNHFIYLTEEERVKGIIPVFNSDVAMAHQGYELGAQQKGDEGFIRAYLQNAANAEFLWMRYNARRAPSVNMPFNYRPVSGYPALIVDGHRSVIGMITSVSHTISVGGGSGSATTTVSIGAPRYFDEGDPYFFEGGSASGASSAPVYYNSNLIPTNSGTGYDVDEDWDAGKNVFGNQTRQCDKYYQLVLGCGSIPYQFGKRKTAVGVNVAYNAAVAGKVGDATTSRRTIVGTFERLSAQDEDAADQFVKSFTARSVVTEEQMMSTFLEARADGVTFARYTGGPFREKISKFVISMNQALGAWGAKKG